MKFEARLKSKYGDLSDSLRQAADFLAANPVDAATRPLRTVSRDSGISPAAFSRLSRALDYLNYEELREEMRAKIGRRVNTFAERAERLQSEHRNKQTSFVEAHLAACQANLEDLVGSVDQQQLDQTVDRLSEARKVLLLGALGSTGVVEYLSYMANFCSENWMMASRMGASLGSGLSGLDERDALIVVTKPPFTNRVIRAAKFAHERGVYVVLITDTLNCPAIDAAASTFVLPSESPHFYSSYVSTVFFAETLIGLMVSRAGSDSPARIAEVAETNKALAEVWEP